MRMWDRLFRKEERGSSDKTSRSFREKDNVGIRLETTNQAVSWWTSRQVQQKFDPFILYSFDNEIDAQTSLSELDCIHVAQDTGKLICTETLMFGYFPSPRDSGKGKFEAILCGTDLTYEMWLQAKEKFSNRNGRCVNEKEPEKRGVLASTSSKKEPEQVTFLREEHQEGIGGTATYRIYKAPSAASAKAFLQENPVDKNFYYIVVETPEGNYGCDVKGIYKE